jgi:tRNA wybutosine-synthesizing protein 3
MLNRFQTRKQKILEQLTVPDEQYQDLSPKGSVDAPIRVLIGDINVLEGLVTTSSCSGRISVFLEGRKADPTEANPQDESAAGPGGKGGGGLWLYISHDPIATTPDGPADFMTTFGLTKGGSADGPSSPVCRYIHLKFEPMVRLNYNTSRWSLCNTDSTYIDVVFRGLSTRSHCRSLRRL